MLCFVGASQWLFVYCYSPTKMLNSESFLFYLEDGLPRGRKLGMMNHFKSISKLRFPLSNLLT